jgi:hypothetical protein
MLHLHHSQVRVFLEGRGLPYTGRIEKDHTIYSDLQFPEWGSNSGVNFSFLLSPLLSPSDVSFLWGFFFSLSRGGSQTLLS